MKFLPLDLNFWTHHSTTSSQIIASFLPLDREPNLAQLRAAFLEQFAVFPRFCERPLREGGWRWVHDEDFSLDRHLKVMTVPAATGIDELRLSAAQEFCNPIDLQHSPWAFTVFNGNGVHAAMFRVHHALADGLGALEFFYRLCHLERTPELSKASGGRDASSVVRTPPRFGMDFWKSVKRLWQELREGKTASAINGSNSSERQFTFLELPLENLVRIRRAFTSSLNDLMLSLTAGCIERYHAARSRPIKRVKVLLPFNIRPRNDTTTMGNHLTGVGVWLPTDTNDPKRRLEIIRNSINTMKRDGSIGAFRLLAVVAGRLPHFFRKRIVDAAARRTNLICTNMPGPEKPLFLAGAQILGNFGCAALLKNQGMAFAFITYHGKMCISLVTDPKIIPHPKELIGYFLESYEELDRLRAEKAAAKSAAVAG